MLPEPIVKPPDHLKRIHVLLADNDQRITSIMSHVLRHLGFSHLFEAQDGFRAVHMLQKHDIDLIITDWDLQPLDQKYTAELPPNPVLRSERWTPVAPKDGACLARYVRNSKYSPNPYVSIIMLTGLGLRSQVEYARDAGVNEIILKPLTVESLCTRISLVIDKPRPFVVSESYKGPCRRQDGSPRHGQTERRRHDVRIFKHAC